MSVFDFGAIEERHRQAGRVAVPVAVYESLRDVPALVRHLRAFETFVRSVHEDYDCDQDAHKYGTQCRACEAKRLLEGGL